MAQYGLGNYVYDIDVEDDGSAHFKFFDPQDPANAEEVVLAPKDFPGGVSNPDSRPVAEAAFNQCAKLLNDKRDARLQAETVAKMKADQAAGAAARENAQEYLSNIQDPATEPDHVEKDGTKVYTVSPALSDASASQSADSGNKKK